VKSSAPIGLIIPSTILNQVDTRAIRSVLLARGLSVLLNLGKDIFGKKVLNTSTVLVSVPPRDVDNITLSDLSHLPLQERKDALDKAETACWQAWREIVSRDPHLTFFVGQANVTKLLDRLRASHQPLQRILAGEIQRGVSPDVVSAHVVTDEQAKEAQLEDALLRPSVSGPQIKRYHDWSVDQYIIYTSRVISITEYPNTLRYLKNHKHKNTCKEVIDGKHPWWALHRPRDPKIFASPKIIGLTTTKTIELIYDPDASVYVTDAMYVFSLKPGIDPWACMAVMQSRAFLFLYRVSNQGEGRVIPQVKASKLQSLPFPDTDDHPKIMQLSQLAKDMTRLQKRLDTARTGQEKAVVRRLLDATDKQIDTLVYELYGLTTEEIKVVEEATR
jgi:adenine-specific DNA-methyltransferase